MSQAILIAQNANGTANSALCPLLVTITNGSYPKAAIIKHIAQNWGPGWNLAMLASVQNQDYPLATATCSGIISETEDLTQVL